MQAALTPDQHSRPHLQSFTHPPVPFEQPNLGRVAVILNRQARRVNDKLARRLEEIAGVENLFYSRSIEEAEAYSREIVRRGYSTVVCGGGDGTLTSTVNLIRRYVAEANACRLDRMHRFGEWQSLLSAPSFAFLRLGTGNALASVVGAGDPIADLEHIVSAKVCRKRSVSMINVGDECCFFAGLGYDSLVLDHYNWLCERTQSALAKPFVHSMGGYFAAVAGRTLPSMLWHRDGLLSARVTTRAPAYYINPKKGDALEEIAAGTVIYEGTTGMVGVGTTPYYGYGLRVYPFAGLVPDMMQLRIANLGAIDALSHLSSIWAGSYRKPDRLLDFMVSDVEIELEQPFPFQHSGDAQGMRKNLRWSIAADKLELLDLYPRSLPS